MQKMKRFGALALAIVMALTLLPAWPGARAATYSGTCGTSLTWTLDTDTGLLEISGTGAMDDWTAYTPNLAPWHENLSAIETVSLPSGVTSIGEYAFYQCTSQQ